jgi:autotransporter-associated beta strand protein
MTSRYYILFNICRISSAIILPLIYPNLSCRAQNEQKMFWALNGSAATSILTWDNTVNSRIDNGSGTWNNVGSNRTWSPDGGATNVPWRPGASAIFGSSNASGGAAGTVTLAASQTVNSLTFNPPNSGSFTFAEGTGNLFSINNNTGKITANANAKFYIGLAGSAGLTLSGTGTITLDSATTFTGTTTINSGTLVLANGITGTYLPTLSTPIFLASAGTLSADLSVDNINIAGNISGPGTLSLLNVAQTQSLRLYGSNSGFTGSFSEPINSRGMMWSDDLGAGNASNTGSAAAAWNLSGAFGFIEANGAATPIVQLGSLTGTNSATNLGGFGGTATSTFQIGALNTNTTFAGSIQDNPQTTGSPTIALIKVGTGTLTLSGSNTYSGATTVNAGVLAFPNSIPSDLNWNITVNATSTPTSANSGLMTLPASPNLTGNIINILLTGTSTGFTWNAITWPGGTAISTPVLQINGTTVTSGTPSGGTTVTFNSTSGITVHR